MFRLNWVTRTMQEICRDLYSHVWWCFFKVSKDKQDNFLSVKMKTQETKSRPSVQSSHSRLEFTCWVPTSNHKRKAWTIQKRHVEIHVEHPVCRFLEWMVFLPLIWDMNPQGFWLYTIKAEQKLHLSNRQPWNFRRQWPYVFHPDICDNFET